VVEAVVADAAGARVLIKSVDGELAIDVQPGLTYDLTASASEGSSGCKIAASSRS
jgi:hypothetical protein